MPIVINADGLVLGRLATNVAKRLLKGDEIVIVNSESAIIAGSRDAIVHEFQHRRFVGSERKGPYYPRMPDRILRRAIRGMLPYRRGPGKEALHRLNVYVGVPKEYTGAKLETVETARKPGLHEYMKLGEVSKILGARV